uniref:Envelope-like protein n=1 Tax=Caenorhabditis tropicalis TaxID=1561998 RepID=A0A1I7U2C2_9PELO
MSRFRVVAVLKCLVSKCPGALFGATVPAWTREYRILGRLARKRWLEEEMITVGISIEEIKELDDLEEELTVEEVRMIDGIMTIQEKL